MHIEYAGSSRIGKRRRNEDRYYLPVEGGPPDLMMVADGMGGHQGGDVASAFGVQVACDSILHSRGKDPGERLVETVREANRVIFRESLEKLEYDGMGTTMTLALTEKKKWFIAHVGDSRAYAYENGVIRQVTEDHSLVAEMEKAGSITHAQARIHPHRNIITRAVGTEPEIDVDLYEVPMLPGQVLMLCSDGLTDPIDDDELAQMLGSGAALSEIAETLVYMAENLGGKDNITVVLARVEEEVSAHG